MGKMQMADNSFSSVTSLVESYSGDTAKALKEQLARRRIVKSLQAMRASKDISQAQIADALGCSQSRVSKLENGFDEDLTLREIEAYAKTLGCSVNLTFSRRGETAVDRIKGLANQIRFKLSQRTFES